MISTGNNIFDFPALGRLTNFVRFLSHLLRSERMVKGGREGQESKMGSDLTIDFLKTGREQRKKVMQSEKCKMQSAKLKNTGFKGKGREHRTERK